MTLVYCGHCGQELTDGGHESCRTALSMEPPRYCDQCRRRMVVQVHPMGWTARCSVHGEIHG
ncbi:biotin synthase auxiliary protein BsaP [Kribbella endophytica]